VAEAFAQSARRLSEIHNLKAWVYQAAFRLAAGEMQMRGHLTSIEDLRDMMPTIEPETDAADILALSQEALSPRQRGVFVLRDLLLFTTRETSKILGVSEVAVRVHLHAAHQRLRASLNSS
jgi:DNA-directed RNA polymerase specialized sigma24 family protein